MLQQSAMFVASAGPSPAAPKQQGIFAQKPRTAVAGASPEAITTTSNASTLRIIEEEE